MRIATALACLLVAGCLTEGPITTQPGQSDGEVSGSFPARTSAPPTIIEDTAMDRNSYRSETGAGCLALELHPTLSASRPGVDAVYEARAVNCGRAELTLIARCMSPFHANITRDDNAWALSDDGPGMAHCPRLLEPMRLVSGESLSFTYVWNGFIATDPCGDMRYFGGIAPAHPGPYLFEINIQTIEGPSLSVGIPLEMMETLRETSTRWPEGNGSYRTVLHVSSLGRPSDRENVETLQVADQATWNSWCEKHSRPGASPIGYPWLDFERERVVIVTWPDRPDGCHDIAVERVDLDPKDPVIRLALIEPREGDACTPLFISPSYALAISREGPWPRVEAVKEGARIVPGAVS